MRKERKAMINNKKNMQKLMLLPLACFLSTALMAQVKDRDLGNINEMVTREFNPVIKDAAKISSNPVINDSTAKIPVSGYNLTGQKINTTFEVEPIPSARMKQEPISKLYSTHLKGGFGNYTMPLGEIYFNSRRSKEYHYGASLRHLSSRATLPDVAYSGFSNNNLSLFGKYFMKDYTLSGDFDYSRNVVNYYGFNPEVFPNINKEDIRQRFNFFNPKVAFESTYKDTTKIHHSTGISYYNFSDLFDGATENNFSLNSGVRKYISKEQIGLNTNFGYWHLNGPQDTTFNMIIGFNPHITSQRKNFKVKVGFNVSLEAATDATGSAEIFPDIEASYNLVKDIIIPYAGVTGGLIERNSYRSLTNVNPFLNADSPMLNSVIKQKYFAGIKGNLSSAVTFNTYFSYADIRNMPLFVNQPDIIKNRFSLVFDNTRVMNMRGELAYQKTEKLKMLIKGDYYKYDLDVQEFAWHRPNFEATFTTFYSLRDKIILKGDIFYVGQRMGRDYTAEGLVEAIPLKGFLDVNLGLEYRYTKHLSAFVNFNNIGAVRYQQWYNYPTQRFNLLGGFSYSF
jgi:hypothetical protein